MINYRTQNLLERQDELRLRQWLMMNPQIAQQLMRGRPIQFPNAYNEYMQAQQQPNLMQRLGGTLGRQQSPFGGMMNIMDALRTVQNQQPMRPQQMVGQQAQQVPTTQPTAGGGLLGLVSKLFMGGLLGGL